jgi:hypothetical protein
MKSTVNKSLKSALKNENFSKYSSKHYYSKQTIFQMIPFRSSQQKVGIAGKEEEKLKKLGFFTTVNINAINELSGGFGPRAFCALH